MVDPDREHRQRSSESPPSSIALRSVWTGLILSLVMLALAPLVVADSYSVVEDTLSESGAQGVDGAWVLRTGALLAAVSVLAMTTMARWGGPARVAIRVYALGLVGLVVFPEAPWDGGSHDVTIAYLHTVSGVVGATAFIFGVVLVSLSRPSEQRGARAFDWLVVAAVALIPQVMLVAAGDGLLQRAMVGLGYIWLLTELAGISERPDVTRKPAGWDREVLPWAGDRTGTD